MRSGHIETEQNLARVTSSWPLVKIRPVLMTVDMWQRLAREAADTLFEDHPHSSNNADPGSMVAFVFNADPAFRRDTIAELKAAAIEAFDARWAELVRQ